ncbi:hypothetical protein A0H81_07887 [Grifola frondosa]|uniref:dolichol kinase n=1 Tax=Grifola frondosa TaxID=5627 RepID=A0A1C7M766_GRIFR|nr:hypothetical protein A0H81_07887 [Grifola frondosa]
MFDLLSLDSLFIHKADTRESKKNNGVLGGSLLKNNESAFVWMTVPKNYRNSLDDGVLTGLIGGPLIAAALLYISLQGQATSNSPLLFTWLVEPPIVLKDNASPISSLEALLLSRRNLVNQSTFCATILLVHVCASWVTEARHRRKLKVPEGEVSSVPRKQGRRTYLYCLFTISVSLWILCVRIALAEMRLGIWQNMNYFEVVVSSVFFQLSLYISMRLAHRGFTFGELGLVCFGATVLFMEMLNLTIARLWPITTSFIKTYRLPTPLLMYQIALIPGSLLTGFLLSPLLYLSRHIAQRPVRRLRYPQEKQKHRRLLALGFYLGAVLIVGGLLGLWTRWCLGNRDPWLWVIFWTLQGRKKWTRPALLAYWVALISISVAGWNRQLARSRRYRHRNAMSISDSLLVPPSPRTASGQNSMDLSDPSAPSTPPNDGTGPLGLAFPNLPNLPNLPNGSHMSNVATDLLDAADKHVPTLGVNARRKFFHALAVVMFVPGIAVDPAFTHLSFSVAFALFTFAEYVRYFALYPFGASVHLFMNEFLDQKDSGTAILSHFYLLTGCANSVWFEGPSRLLLFTGTLVLGVGDALASIVGKRLGKHRWFAVNPKTVEGSAAFVVSVVTCAWLLWLCGFTEDFSIVRYTAVAALSAGLEAFSVQNDNLTLPLYMWSMLVFADGRQISGLRAEASRLSGSADTLPSPFDPSPTNEYLPQAISVPDKTVIDSDYDWATFINAYSLGKWDPLKTPRPPRSHLQAPSHPHSSRSDCQASVLHGQYDLTFDSPELQPLDWQLPELVDGCSLEDTDQTIAGLRQSAPTSIDPNSVSSTSIGQQCGSAVGASSLSKHEKRLSVPLNLGSFSYRLRNSFADMRSSAGSGINELAISEIGRSQGIPTSDATTSAAAIRLAAARVSVAPLALPSPEHELTDPMRGVTATIPGSHPPDLFMNVEPGPLMSPNGTRKSRLSSFWQGTQDIEDSAMLPTIEASPPEPVVDGVPDQKGTADPICGYIRAPGYCARQGSYGDS